MISNHYSLAVSSLLFACSYISGLNDSFHDRHFRSQVVGLL